MRGEGRKYYSFLLPCVDVRVFYDFLGYHQEREIRVHGPNINFSFNFIETNQINLHSQTLSLFLFLFRSKMNGFAQMAKPNGERGFSKS